MEKYHTGFQRLFSVFIDNIILQLCMWPFGWLILKNFSVATNVLAAVAVSAIPVSYSVYMHGRFGQTLGKYMCGVRVVDLHGKSITYQQVIMRDIVPCLLLPIWIWTMVFISVYREYPPAVMFRWAEHIGIYWAVLELTTMLFNEQRRAIHDYIAQTVVIRVNRPF